MAEWNTKALLVLVGKKVGTFCVVCRWPNSPNSIQVLYFFEVAFSRAINSFFVVCLSWFFWPNRYSFQWVLFFSTKHCFSPFSTVTISLFPLLSSHPSSSFADLISFLSLFPLSVFLSRTSLVLISIYSFSFSHQLYYFGILFGLNRLSTRVCYFFLLVFGSAFWLWPRVIGALLVN